MIARTNKSWTSKPPVAGTRINWSNPITRGLQCAFAMADGIGPPRCSITGPPLSSGTPGWMASFSGRAPLYTASPTVTTRVPFASQTVGSITLSCWMRTTAASQVFAVSLCSTSNNIPIVGIQNASASPGTLAGWWRNDAGTQYRVDATNLPYNDGRWRHVVVTFSTASQFQIYVNGVNASFDWPLGTWPVSGNTTVDGLCLGSLVRTTSASYDVAVDQACYWNRLLTEGEIYSLYIKPWQIYAPPAGQLQVGSTAGTLTYYLWNSEIEEDFNVLTY